MTAPPDSHNTTVLILAAGEGTGWSNHLCIRKQQIPIAGGETILDRTIRLTRAEGHDPILITHASNLTTHNIPTSRPARRRWTTDTLHSTRALWRHRTIVLLGDVIYEPRVIHDILAETAPLAIYARQGINWVSGKPGGERFGLSFHRSAWPTLCRAIAEVEETFTGYRGREGKLSTLMKHLPKNAFVVRRVRGYTEDMDRPYDYIQFMPRIERAMKAPAWRQRLMAVRGAPRTLVRWALVKAWGLKQWALGRRFYAGEFTTEGESP